MLEEYLNSDEKLTDKPFLRLAITSLLAILLCIFCLCSTTYAWFNGNTPNHGNEIATSMAGDFSVALIASDGTPLEDIEDGVKLIAGETYTVELSLGGGNASGYCLITAGQNTYYSPYILRHENEEREYVRFALTVEEDQRVKFTPRWGIYSGECDVEGDELLIP